MPDEKLLTLQQPSSWNSEYCARLPSSTARLSLGGPMLIVEPLQPSPLPQFFSVGVGGKSITPGPRQQNLAAPCDCRRWQPFIQANEFLVSFRHALTYCPPAYGICTTGGYSWPLKDHFSLLILVSEGTDAISLAACIVAEAWTLFAAKTRAMRNFSKRPLIGFYRPSILQRTVSIPLSGAPGIPCAHTSASIRRTPRGCRNGSRSTGAWAQRRACYTFLTTRTLSPWSVSIWPARSSS